MKKVLFILTVMAIMVSCSMEPKPPSADQVLANQTERAMQEGNRETGYPAITNFQEKKVMKYIYELRDQEDLICYAYFFNEREGKIGDFIGKCIGYGMPYSTQFSNPEKEVYRHYESGVSKMPQPEPNGLFMPEGLAATWLLLIDPETDEPKPVYIEPMIIVSPFKLK